MSVLKRIKQFDTNSDDGGGGGQLKVIQFIRV